MVLGFLTGPPSVSRGGYPKNKTRGLQIYRSSSSAFPGHRVIVVRGGKMPKENGDSRDEDVLYHLSYANHCETSRLDNVVLPEIFHTI
mmetsp:Transcript_14318/g.20826  ORF Transcript_14318/g.20826 Transcript_14318/m.20826 type:complete len:88 (+) Transcript_14318:83-346(+)